MRIYLIGFMSSGKSTLGQYVADVFNVPFFDTDRVVESQSEMTVEGIFEIAGEKEFRELEADVLRQTIIYPTVLIATGGGLPCHYENMDWMNEHGITIYLSWPDPVLISHLKQQTAGRPLLSALDSKDQDGKIATLLEERKPYYELSSMTVEMTGHLDEDKLKIYKACRYIL